MAGIYFAVCAALVRLLSVLGDWRCGGGGLVAWIESRCRRRRGAGGLGDGKVTLPGSPTGDDGDCCGDRDPQLGRTLLDNCFRSSPRDHRLVTSRAGYARFCIPRAISHEQRCRYDRMDHLFRFVAWAASDSMHWQTSHSLDLFDSFFRVGSFVFGGGHVVLPLLQAEVVGPGWVTDEQFVAGYGATQAVPGPLFTFSAYLGAVMNGWSGALLALVAIFLPSFLLIVGALPFWDVLRSEC